MAKVLSSFQWNEVRIMAKSRTSYPRKDLTGMKFGKLTVLYRVSDYISPLGQHLTRYKCQCECGNFTEVDGTKLRRNETLSCGCLTKDNFIQYNRIRRRDNRYNNIILHTQISPYKYYWSNTDCNQVFKLALRL